MNFNKLTDAELERLTLIGEECSEVSQAVCKATRHGLECCHPVTLITNRNNIEKEIGDALGVIDFAIKNGDFNLQNIEHYRRIKMAKTAQYLHHNTIEISNE